MGKLNDKWASIHFNFLYAYHFFEAEKLSVFNVFSHS